jgi:hypothetical protein
MLAREWEALIERIAAPPTDQKFKVWMRKVDAVLAKRFGLTTADLDDCLYDDWFADGMAAATAAAKAYRNAGGNA